MDDYDMRTQAELAQWARDEYMAKDKASLHVVRRAAEASRAHTAAHVARMLRSALRHATEPAKAQWYIARANGALDFLGVAGV